MQTQPGDAWANGFAGVDCSWGTRGAAAVHGGTTMRALAFWGALLAFWSMSRNNPENPHCTTSCSMECVGVREMCPELRDDGFGTTTLLCGIDGDVKTAALVKQYWSHMIPRLCSGIENSLIHPCTLFVLKCKLILYQGGNIGFLNL